MESLSDRQKSILRALVSEYIYGAEPIPSDLIAKKYELGVRSATVRHELAEITHLGYLEQPHTSAGRVPSDEGYRYYVDHLIVHRRLTPKDKKTIQAAASEEETTRELVSDSIKSLSNVTRLLTAAVTVRDAEAQVRNAVISVLGPGKALLIIVLQNGHVENKIIETPSNLNIEELGQANHELSLFASGQKLISLVRSKPSTTGKESIDALLKTATTALKHIAKELTSGHLILDGEEFILSQPEYQKDSNALHDLLDSLGDEDSLMVELSADEKENGSISIGRENKLHRHRSLTFMRTSFFVGEEQAGIIALVGPTRMEYDRNSLLLDYTAKEISKTLTKLFG